MDHLSDSSSTQVGDLCVSCQQIKVIPLGPRSFEHLSLNGLIRSAEHGCPCCQLILDETRDFSNFVETSPCRIELILLAKTKSKMQHVITTEKEKFITEFEFFDLEDIFKLYTKESWASLQIGRALLQTLDSAKGHQLIRSWVNRCEQTHSMCSQGPTLLPSRVLDLSGTNPRLVEGGGTKARYISLSHCWGLVPLLVTTMTTLADRMQEIPIASFPATFSDAVRVAKLLEVRYLWIDSLCIIQDSKEDWLLESGKMRQYYQEAFVVLSVLDGHNSNHGIFNPRDNLPGIELSQPFLALRPILAGEHTVFSNSVLTTRAWALQERLLATRTIHFSEKEMFWECASYSTRESNPVDYEDKANDRSNTIYQDNIVLSEGGNFKRLISNLRYQPRLQTSLAEKKIAMSTWYRLVAQYTRRCLTRSTDKLPAISAIASEIHSITGFTYIAGIWEEDLQSLLWFSSKPETKASTYQAPSWSWASTNGQISLRFDSEVAVESPEDARIIEASTSVLGPSPFGPVTSGSLTLHARTIELQYTFYSLTQTEVILRSPKRLASAVASVVAGAKLRGYHEFIPHFGQGMLDYISVPDSLQGQDPSHWEGSSVTCTAVFIQNHLPTQVAMSLKRSEEVNTDIQQHYTKWFMLVVKSITEPVTWKRIGTVYTFSGALESFIDVGLGEWTERELVIL